MVKSAMVSTECRGSKGVENFQKVEMSGFNK